MIVNRTTSSRTIQGTMDADSIGHYSPRPCIPSYVKVLTNEHISWPGQPCADYAHNNNYSQCVHASPHADGHIPSSPYAEADMDHSHHHHHHHHYHSRSVSGSTGYHTWRHRKGHASTASPASSSHALEPRPARMSVNGARIAETWAHMNTDRAQGDGLVAAAAADHVETAHEHQHEHDAVDGRPAGCYAHAPLSLALDLVPPFRFAMVEDGVYRGAYPTLRNFPFLRQRGIRTILSLTPEPPSVDLTSFAQDAHIALRHIHVDRYKGEVTLLPAHLGEALHTVLHAAYHPVYLHCLDGRQVTGVVVMALRKLQQWSVPAMQAEYVRVAREVHDAVSFVSDYTGPVRVPTQMPVWWDYRDAVALSEGVGRGRSREREEEQEGVGVVWVRVRAARRAWSEADDVRWVIFDSSFLLPRRPRFPQQGQVGVRKTVLVLVLRDLLPVHRM